MMITKQVRDSLKHKFAQYDYSQICYALADVVETLEIHQTWPNDNNREYVERLWEEFDQLVLLKQKLQKECALTVRIKG